MTPTPQQFTDLMNRLTQHSRDMEAANAHDRSYVLGWRAATNTAIVALWSALNGNHEIPWGAPNTVEGLRRVICKTCQHVQFKSGEETTGCVACGGNTLSFYRRATDVDTTECTKCAPDTELLADFCAAHDGSGNPRDLRRKCNHHHEQHCGKPATVVCRTANGLEWFACDVHNVDACVPGGDMPTTATPIGEWLTKYVPPFDNADHDRALCDCMECENWRRCEESHNPFVDSEHREQR